MRTPLAVGLLAMLVAVAATPAARAAMSVSMSDVTIANQAILPSSPPTAVVSINAQATDPDNVARANDTLTVSVQSVNNFNAATDIVAIYLFRDSSASAGTFNYDNFGLGSATGVPPMNGIYPTTSGLCLGYYGAPGLTGGNNLGAVSGNVNFNTVLDTLVLPTNDTGSNAGADFFIAVQTSDNLKHRAQFRVVVTYTPGAPPATPAAQVTVTTNTLTCEYYALNMTDRSNYHGWSWGMVHLTGVDGNPFESANIMGINTPYLLFGLNIAGRSGMTTNTTEYLAGLNVLFTNQDSGAIFASHLIANYPDVSVWEDTNDDGYFNPTFELTSGGSAGTDRFVGPPNVSGGPVGSMRAHNAGAMTPYIDGRDGGSYAASERVIALQETADNRVDFFVCLTTDPSHIWVTSTPVYGDRFNAVLNDIPAGTRSINFWYARQSGNDPHTGSPKRVLDTIRAAQPSTNVLGDPEPVDMTISLAINKTPSPNGVIEADGFPAPIFNFNMADGIGLGRNESLEQIRIWFSGTGFKPTDLMPLTDDEFSGVSLWWDNKPLGMTNSATDRLGQFDPPHGVTWVGQTQNGQNLHSTTFTDTNIPLSSGSLTWYNGGNNTPWSPFNDTGPDYYVVLKPKAPIAFPPNDYDWQNNLSHGHATVGDSESFDGGSGINARGPDLFICVRANGLKNASYGANWWERGMDRGDQMIATIKSPQDILYTRKGVNTSWDQLPASTTATLGTLPLAYNVLTTQNNHPITPRANTAVLGINLVSPPSAPTNRITKLVVQVRDTGTVNFDISDLIDPVCVHPRQNHADGGCGIAVYIDNPIRGQIGVFDPYDIRMPMSAVPYIAGPPQLPMQLHLAFTPEQIIADPGNLLVGTGGAADQATGPVPASFGLPADAVFQDRPGGTANVYNPGIDAAWVDTNHSGAYEAGIIPTTDTGVNQGNDFFLVIRPTKYMDPGDDFTLQVYNVWYGDDKLSMTGGATHITTRFTTHRMRNLVVTNDVLTDETTPGLLARPNQGPFPTMGINAFDPTGQGRLNSLRVYFNPQGNLNPNDIFATLLGGTTGGLSLWNIAANANIPVQPGTWYNEANASLVYHQVTVPPTPPVTVNPGTVLNWFRFNESVCWADNDQDGKWSPGDALWINNGNINESAVRYNHGFDTPLVATVDNNGNYGVILQHGLYGFGYYDTGNGAGGPADGNFNLDEDVFFLGPGRNTLGWYTDLALVTPVAVPTSDTGGDAGKDFEVRFRTNPNPPIFGTLGWTFSIPHQSITYNTGYSSANRDLTTTTIRLEVVPTTIGAFTATRGAGRVTLNWTLPGGTFTSVVIVRTPTNPPGAGEVPLNGVPYAVGQPVGNGTIVYMGSGTSFVDNGVVNGTPYYYWAFAGDRPPTGAGAEDMVQATPWPVTPTEDSTPPGVVTGVVAVPGNNQVFFTWEDPLDLDLAEVLIVRSSTDYPVVRPANETAYAVGANLGDGVIIGKVAAGVQAFVDDGDLGAGVPAPVNGTTYYYTFYTRDGFLNYSAPAFTNCMPSDGSAPDPRPVTSFGLSVVIDAFGNHDVNIAWNWPAPVGNPETGLIIVRHFGGAITGTPRTGRLYRLGDLLATGETGTVVAIINGTAAVTYTDQDVMGGGMYYYAAFTFNSMLEYSTGAYSSQVVSSAVVSYADLTSPGQTIEFNSDPTPVIGINLYDNGQDAVLSSVTVQFNRLGNNSIFDLADINGSSAASGVALYRDVNNNGVFNPGVDVLVPFSVGSGWSRGRPATYDRKMDTPILDLTNWRAVDGVPGTQTGVFFQDLNNNGAWDPGEDVWTGANPFAGAPASVVLYTGGSQEVGSGAAGIQTGLYYFDEDGSNSYTPGESLWRDESWPRMLTMNLTSGLDVPDTDAGGRADLFVVIRTSRTIQYGTQVQLAIPGTFGLTFFGEEAGVAGLTTNAVTCRIPTTLTNLVPGGQTVPVSSPGTAVIGMDLADPAQTVDSLVLDVLNVGGDFDITPSDFIPYIGLEQEGPISFWRDMRPVAPSHLAGVITATAAAGSRTHVRVLDTDFAALGVRVGDTVRRVVGGTPTTASVTALQSGVTANDTLVFLGGLTGAGGDHSLEAGEVFTVETRFLVASSPVINVADATHYPQAGLVLLGRELIAYDGKDAANNLLNVQRGVQGTAAVVGPHPVGEGLRVVGMSAELAADITAAGTTLTLAAGQGARFLDPNLGYTAYVRIGSEVIGYRRRVGDQLQQCTRGARGSDAIPHIAGETVNDAMALTLAADIDAGATVIDVLERPFDPAGETGVGHVTIGLETISYTAVIRRPAVWRLSGCGRGTGGTTAAVHAAGDAVIQGRPGTFDLGSDSLVFLASLPASGMSVPLNIRNQRLSPMIDGINDFFVTVKTSATASHDDDFQVRLTGGTLDFSVPAAGDSQRGITSGTLRVDATDTTPPVITQVRTLDLNRNGMLDHALVTFSEPIRDASLTGYISEAIAFLTNHWIIQGYTGVGIDPNGTTGMVDAENDNRLVLFFNERAIDIPGGWFGDTGVLVGLSTAGTTLTDLSTNPGPNPLNGGVDYAPGQLLPITVDGAAPVLVDAFSDRPLTLAGEIQAGTVITLRFSEPITSLDVARILSTDFLTDPDGASGQANGFAGINPADVEAEITPAGRVALTFAQESTSGGVWTEDATMNLDPAGISEGDIVDLVGFNALRAPAPVRIRGLGTVMVVSAETGDANRNGRIDHIRITFDRPINDATLAGYPGTGGLIDVAANGGHFQVGGRGMVMIDLDGPYGTDLPNDNVLYLVFGEGGAPDTAETPTFTIAGTPLRSRNGEFTRDYSAPATDGAPPVMIDVITFDWDEDGQVDMAVVGFSEKVVDATADPGDFTIGGRPVEVVETGMAALFPAFPNLPDDEVLVLRILTPANQVLGTEFKTVAYTLDNDAWDLTDLLGNKMASETDGGRWGNKVDAAKPTIQSARTLSDASIQVVFSENVLGVTTAMLRTNGGTLALGNLQQTGPRTYVWSDPAGGARWNTDATGASPGDVDDSDGHRSTDSQGTPRNVIPNLSVAGGAFSDAWGNANLPIVNSPMTADGVPPVAIAVSTMDDNLDGRVDSARIVLSEPMAEGSLVAAHFRVGGVPGSVLDPGAVANDQAFIIRHGGVAGTELKAVGYTAGTAADLSGNLLASNADLGFIKTDLAKPQVLSAATRSDRSVELRFSEPIAAPSADALWVNAGSITFGAVDPSNNPVIVWSAATATWNTDATGTSAGLGVDADGIGQTAIVDLAIAPNAIEDLAAVPNGIDAFASGMTVDGAPPVVTKLYSTVPPGSTHTLGQLVPILVDFSERVTVTGGSPSLTVQVSDTAQRTLSYQSGSGSRTLRFNYTVAAGDNRLDPDFLDCPSTTAMAFAGSNIIDFAPTPNRAVLTLPQPGLPYSPGGVYGPLYGHHVQVDTIPPTVFAVQTVDHDTVRVVFSEKIRNDADQILAALPAIGISDGGTPGALLPFDAVSLDADNAVPTSSAAELSIAYFHMTAPAKRWNTDAHGTSAGVGTDGDGTVRAAVPRLIVGAGLLHDLVNNPMAAVSFDGTTDGAPPVALRATYHDTTVDGRVDVLQVVFSEPVNLGPTVGWSVVPNDLPISPILGAFTRPSDRIVAIAVTGTIGTGVDALGGEFEPVLTYDDGGAGHVVDRSPAANFAIPFGLVAADRAGPVLVAADLATPSVVRVAFSEKLEAATVDPAGADFLHSLSTVTAAATVDDWAGARLTIDPALTLNAASTVRFAAGMVVADPSGNPNSHVAAVALAPYGARVYMSGPVMDEIHRGALPVDVTGMVDVLNAVPEDDLDVWSLYLVQGQGAGRLPLGDPSTRLLNGPVAVPLTPEGVLGTFTPDVDAVDGVYHYTIVLEILFTTGEAPLLVYREVVIAKDLAEVGLVNDGLGIDIDFQQSVTQLSGNWTGVAVAGVVTGGYEVAYSTEPATYPADPAAWTNVGLATTATLAPLGLVNGETYYFKVRALDTVGTVIAVQSSDGVTVDAVAPAVGTVRDGGVPGIDLDWQASDSSVGANWDGFADPGAADLPPTGSGISRYEWAIFQQGGVAQDPGTDVKLQDWASVGLATSATTALLPPALLHGQPYYVAVRAVDAVGNVGLASYSNGFRPDLNPPLAGAVRDGLGADIDITSSMTTLSGNWDAFAEPDSGLQTYQYRIATDVDRITAGWEQRALPAQGALNQGRTRFGVVVLPDGRLMAIGGWTGVSALASVEVYNPVTGAWTYASAMNRARFGAAVVGLPGGDVIVAGGSNGSAYLSSIERYSAFTGTWTEVGNLAVARENAVAAVVGDHIWVMGGRGAVDPIVPALGGYRDVIEAYSLVSGTVATVGSLSQPRAGAMAQTLMDGRLLVLGGQTATGYSAVTDVFTPGTPGAWSATSMITARADFAGVMLPGGDLLVIGGLNGTGRLAAVERFRAASGTWTAVAPMATPRAHHAATWVESTGTVLVAGGVNAAMAFEKTTADYDPDNDVWTPSAPLVRSRGYHRLAAFANGAVMAFGGLADWNFMNETEVRRLAAPFTPWQDTTDTQATVAGLGLVLGQTYYFQVRAYDVVGNRSPIATSDGVLVSRFSEPPVIVTLVGPATVAVGESFTVNVYVRENNADAQGFRGGPLDIRFSAAQAQVAVAGGFTPAAVLAAPFKALGEAFTSGTLNNAAGLIDELGGATTANGLGEGPAPGALYASIPFTASASGVCTITAGPGQSGLVLTPPVGAVPPEVTDFGLPLNVTVLTGITLSVDGGISAVNEGGAFTVRATATAVVTEPVTVILGFSGTAVFGVDYRVPGLPLVIQPGTRSATVTVLTENDGLPESNESIVVAIDAVNSLSGGYAEVGVQSVAVAIIDSGVPGDANGDGKVDYADLMILIGEYGRTTPPAGGFRADFNGDGRVDYYDLMILIANYGVGAKEAEAAVAAGARAAGPSAVVTLVGPDRVLPGEVFAVDVFVQVDDPRGFGGGPVTVDFATARLDYSGAFTPNSIIQPPFNGIFTSGVLNEALGRIADLGGATISAGNGYGSASHYARLYFSAVAAGPATIAIGAGSIPLAIVGGGDIPAANTTFANALTVTVGADNRAPSAQSTSAATGAGQPVTITLAGSDPDGDPLSFVLPAPGHAWHPQHGSLGPVAGSGATRTVTYTPDAGYVGIDTFIYTVHDGDLASNPATVSITVGGFLADLVVSRGADPYLTLVFGMQPGAGDTFSPADGDYMAPPAGALGEAAFFTAPYGELLSRDIRGVGDTAVWKLTVRVPGGTTRETWTLGWQGSDLPAGYTATLVPATPAWEPNGTPVDMATEAGLSLANSGAGLQTYTFLLTVTTKQTAVLTLKPGWNLVGIPLSLDAAAQQAILGDPRILAIYRYSEGSGYSVPSVLLPGRAYWVYVTATVNLALIGSPVVGGTTLAPGWNFVAPYRAVPNPIDFTTVIAVWAWSPETGYYIPDLDDPQAVAATTGLWVYATQATVIWQDAP